MAKRPKLVRWTESCSGCCESIDGQHSGYKWDDKAKCYVGSGCRECGYTGKRRQVWSEDDLKEMGEMCAANKQGGERE